MEGEGSCTLTSPAKVDESAQADLVYTCAPCNPSPLFALPGLALFERARNRFIPLSVRSGSLSCDVPRRGSRSRPHLLASNDGRCGLLLDRQTGCAIGAAIHSG